MKQSLQQENQEELQGSTFDDCFILFLKKENNEKNNQVYLASHQAAVVTMF